VKKVAPKTTNLGRTIQTIGSVLGVNQSNPIRSKGKHQERKGGGKEAK
jgi:hypothetical protein